MVCCYCAAECEKDCEIQARINQFCEKSMRLSRQHKTRVRSQTRAEIKEASFGLPSFFSFLLPSAQPARPAVPYFLQTHWVLPLSRNGCPVVRSRPACRIRASSAGKDAGGTPLILHRIYAKGFKQLHNHPWSFATVFCLR